MTTGERPETGPMRFGDDCRGVFLRGDNACDYAMQLEAALDPRNGPEMRALFAAQLQPLVALLHGANEFVEAPGEQVLRSFAACVGPDPRTPRLPTMALDDATLAAIAPRPTRPTTASPPTTLAGSPEALAGLGGAAPPRSTSCHAFGDSCHDLSNVCHGTGDPR